MYESAIDCVEAPKGIGAASKLFGGFSMLALTLCCDISMLALTLLCDIRDIFFVGFLSKPDRKSALVASNSLEEQETYICNIWPA